MESPIGHIQIEATEDGICGVHVDNTKRALTKAKNKHATRAEQVLKKYFAGKLADFHDLPLTPVGTEFQRAVWRATQKIPAGQTVTYGEIAKRIGRPGAARAVGNALNRNPLLILVPCHRILPAGGDNKFHCGGFALGSKTKRWLLEHELSQ